MKTTKILIAEHDPSDLEMIQNELLKGGIKYIAEIVKTEPEYINALKTFIPDIIFSDYSFPSFNGTTAFKIKEKTSPDTPFILISGTIGEENSIELIKNGVTDFVLKDKMFTLNTKFRRALKDAENKKQKNKTDKELVQSETHLAEAQKLAKMGSWDFDIEADRFTWSKELYNVFGVDNKIFSQTHGSFISLVDDKDRLRVQQTSRHTQLTGDPYTLEYNITTPLSEERIIREHGYGMKDEHGKVTRLFGTAQDITATKRSEAAIIKLHDEKNAILESIEDGFFAVDKNSLITYWNEKAEKLLDKKREDVIGKNLHEIFGGGDSNIFYDNYQKAIRDSVTVRFEAFSKRSNKWFAVSAFASDLGLSVYFKDVTEQKNDEEKIIESELRYRSIIEQATDAICIADASMKIIDINPYGCEMLGYSKAEFMQLTINDLFLQEDLLTNPFKIEDLRSGKVIRNERRFKSKEGTLIDVEMSGRILSDGRFIVFGHDIAERKITEQQREFDRINLNALINNTSDLMWSLDREYKLITFNQPFFDVIKLYTGKELIKGGDVFDVALSPEQVERFKTAYARAFSGETFTEIEHIAAPFESWSEISYNPICKGGEVIGTACYSRDITESKKAEVSLGQSEKRYRQIVETAQEGIWLIDENNKTTFVNNKMCEILEYTREEMMGRTNLSFKDESEQVNALQQIERRKKGITEIHEATYIKKSGKTICTQVSTNPIFNEDGHYKGALAMVTDITERKKGEQLLITQEKRYRALVENGDDAVVIISPEGKLQYASPTVEKILGYTEEEILKLDVFSFIHPDDAPAIGKVWEQVLASPGVSIPNHAGRMLHKNGKWRWMEATVTNMLHDPALNGIVDNFRDVTEKRELENLLNKTNSLARIGSWEIDLIKNTVYWSDIIKEIHEVEHDYIPDLQKGISFYKEGESRDLVIQKVKDAIENGISWDTELQIITDTGKEKWVRLIGETEFLNGKAVRINGSFQDIDIRKRAELGVKEVLEEKNSILESIDDAFFAVDKNWTVTYWNNQASKVLRKTKIEMLDHNLWEVFSDSIDSESYIKYHHAITNKQSVHFEDYYPALEKWYEISAYPSENGLSVYFKDVSERKLYEMQLSELNENLQKQAKALTISNADLEQFAYVASHDLQEPLRMVTSFLTQLEKKYGSVIDDKGKQYIEFAVDGAKRMRQIILDLLEFSRVGRSEDMQEDIDLNELVEEIQILFRKQIEEKEAIIISNPLPRISGYRSPMRQVFQNLIGNALKYTKNEQAPRINITCTELKDHWQFAVNDNGIGIEKEYFDKIFIIFQRLHNKNEFSGTGMGLAITKKIIESHGGKIWLDSEEGKGSTFYFTLLKHH